MADLRKLERSPSFHGVGAGGFGALTLLGCRGLGVLQRRDGISR